MVSFIFFSCSTHLVKRDYRYEMRKFVRNISEWVKNGDPDFIVIPQNGEELITGNGEPSGSLESDYLGAIDGIGREELFFGFNNDDEATPAAETDRMIRFLDLAELNGVEVLVTDYCSTPANISNSNDSNMAKGYISFAAGDRELDFIPSYLPFNENTGDIASLSDAKNFLYILDPTVNYADKDTFLTAVGATNYDIIIMDLYYDESTKFTAADIDGLKTKANGKSRLVIAYMSIGEAEDYRYYWNPAWDSYPPSWIEDENPNWPHNYKVRYWVEDWQNIIYGNSGSYLQKIVDSHFNGVYLDVVDSYEYFEDKYYRF